MSLRAPKPHISENSATISAVTRLRSSGGTLSKRLSPDRPLELASAPVDARLAVGHGFRQIALAVDEAEGGHLRREMLDEIRFADPRFPNNIKMLAEILRAYVDWPSQSVPFKYVPSASVFMRRRPAVAVAYP